ncbi:hypothetical protein [Homoserinibacter sp. GY 40078]|uniref:hypothetical protein n=1 Tax=Homoserinibacter sp. GY 40078 TaxID=2603275 RepID=UPI0011CA20C7|nr:hypothetical protein [Homoserinibacter sp. GY 40078]TXK17173.1 hypothetical protein FVQ89_09940 [Homoserinibacter sp. GY 40078]
MHDIPHDLARRPFSVQEALARGMTPGQLRRMRWARPYPGVRSSQAPPEDDIDERCRHYLPRLGADEYFSHLTAARLWDLWLPTRVQPAEPLHVTVTGSARAPRIQGVIGHHIEPDAAHATFVRGLPVSTPIDTIRMISPSLSLEALIVVLDGVRRRTDPLVGERSLLHMLAKHRGRRGIRMLRAAYELSRLGVDSPRETRLRRRMVLAGLPEPAVNAVISRPGAPERRGDLVFASWGVVVEYEGEHHQSDRATYVSDIARFEQLRDDWTFVRVTAEHMRDIPALIARIRRARRR